MEQAAETEGRTAQIKETVVKELEELNLPGDIRYSREHEWVRGSDGIIRIGIDDYAQDQLGEIVYVELPEIGLQMVRGDELGSVESVKAVSEVYSPVSGEVVAVNEKLQETPELINESCYEEGWIAELKPAFPAELDALMSNTEYLESLKA